MLRRDIVRNALAAVAATISAYAIVVMFWRIRHGIDYTDEAFYIAMPVRFALGDRPFVDELNITQTAAMLLYPFVKVYTAVVGSATGIFLFVRLLYLAFFGGVGFATYSLAALRLPKPTALILATTCLCFLPYGVAGLSYNTISMGLFTIGLFVVARWLLVPDGAPSFFKSRLLWAGFAHGAAAFAYPTLTLAILAATVAIFLLASGHRVYATIRYAVGGVGFGLVVAPFLLRAGSSHLKQVLAYTGSDGGYSAAAMGARFSTVIDKIFAQHPQLPFAAFVTLLAIVIVRRAPFFGALILLYVPLLARGSLPAGNSASMGYVACFALLAPLFCLGLRDARTATVLGIGVAAPSAIAGVAVATTSGNGVLATALGLFPGAILAAVVLAMILDEASKRWTFAVLRPVMALSPVVFLWALLGYVKADDGFYREAPATRLTAKITTGPYKGIYTTPERKESLAALSDDLLARVHGPRALFYYDFPAGYLITMRRPLTHSVWPFPMPARTVPDEAYFRAHAEAGELVFRDGPVGHMPLDAIVAETCDVLAKHGQFTLLTVR